MKNQYELVKLNPTLKDNRDDKRIRKRNEVYNLAKMKLDSWIKMTLISEDVEIEMKQAILEYFDENGRVKEVIWQISVIVTNIDNQNKIYYNPIIPTIKYQITQ